MKSYVEIRIRLNLNDGKTLHHVLRRFAQKTEGWKWAPKQSKDYQSLHGSPAGHVISDSIEGLERVAVAVANVNPKRSNTFRVTNIVPEACSNLTMEQYNAIAQKFADSFRLFLRTTKEPGDVEVEGPDIGLPQIISAPKCRRFFEAYLCTPAPLSHPSDIQALDLFICALFRYGADVRSDEIERYLLADQNWKPVDAAWVRKRIDTGLDILKVDRRF